MCCNLHRWTVGLGTLTRGILVTVERPVAAVCFLSTVLDTQSCFSNKNAQGVDVCLCLESEENSAVEAFSGPRAQVLAVGRPRAQGTK